MSADSEQPAAQQGAGPAPGQGEPTEEELRAAYEAELSRITTTDMMAQAAVSLLNIGARRLAPPPEEAAQRDLEQARDAIDGVKALLDILDRRIPQELGPLRDALSRLQMAYAAEMQQGSPGAPEDPGSGGGDSGGDGPAAPSGEPQAPQEGSRPDAPGPAESSGRLWVPGR